MTPLRFGPTAQQLFGAYHPSAAGQLASQAILLCNPFGQEAIRTQRMLRVLAERLARAGCAVLCFDYFGTGDSAGDDHQGHLTHWRNDILLAHQELQRRTPSAAGRITWLGVRLGGTLACMAANAAQPEVQRLVLWEPLFDGPAYLAELAQDHQTTLANSYGTVPPKYQTKADNEAIGFGMSDTLLTELNQLQPDQLMPPANTYIHLVARAEQHTAKNLMQHWATQGVRCEALAFEL
jgi:uncharacterized protein